jgi:hypothetical protein
LLLELESKEFEVEKGNCFGSTPRLNLNLFRFRFICLRIEFWIKIQLR